MSSTNWSQLCVFTIQFTKIYGRSQTSSSSFKVESSTLIFFIQKSALGTYFYLLYVCKVPEWLFPTHYLRSISQLAIKNNSCSIYCPLIFHSFIPVRSAVSRGVGNYHVWHQEAAAQLALEIPMAQQYLEIPFGQQPTSLQSLFPPSHRWARAAEPGKHVKQAANLSECNSAA